RRHVPSRAARTRASISRSRRPGSSAGSCSARARTPVSCRCPSPRECGDAGFADRHRIAGGCDGVDGGNVNDADPAVGPLREAVAAALDEDLGVLGDLTSQATVPEAAARTGRSLAPQAAVLAGATSLSALSP